VKPHLISAPHEVLIAEGAAAFSRKDHTAGNLGGHRRLVLVLEPHVTYCNLDVISLKSRGHFAQTQLSSDIQDSVEVTSSFSHSINPGHANHPPSSASPSFEETASFDGLVQDPGVRVHIRGPTPQKCHLALAVRTKYL
jgi:hypothetical protein